jgi:hypothetical protein
LWAKRHEDRPVARSGPARLLTYEYVRNGALVAVHERHERAHGDKSFTWRRADGSMGLGGLTLAELPLYRLPELEAAPVDTPVLFVEGEKACEAARARGFVAVCLGGGAAQTAFGAALEPLRGRTVALWPDNDEAGRTYMNRLGVALAGVAADVRWLDVPDLPAKGDAADYFIAGRTADELRALIAAAKPSVAPHVQVDLPQPATAESAWPAPPGDAAFRGLAGRVVAAIDPHSESDRVALLANFLSAFGSALGAAPYAAVGAARHPARDNFVLVGKSSKARKGDSWHPIARLFQVADPDWKQKCVQGGLSSGEGLIWAVRDAVERNEPVKEKGHVVRYERVIADEGVSDKRLLVVEPEFARVLTVMGRQGNTLSPVLRDAWDVGDLRVMTKGAAVASGAHISVVGHITSEELQRELDDTEAVNGFANRFIWLAVRRSKLLPNPDPFEGEKVDALGAEIRKALEFGRGVGRIVRDPSAEALWAVMYESLSKEMPGLVGGVMGRAEAHVLRLSVLYALLDRSSVVKPCHLEAAAELWGYSEQSLTYVFGTATGDPIADTIERSVRTTGELTRAHIGDLFNRHVSSNRIDQAVALLVRLNRVRVEQRDTGGRPAQVLRPAA